MAKEADRGTFFPVLLFGYLFRGLVTQGLEAGRGLIFPVQNGDGSVDKVTVFCGDIIFLCGVFHDIVHFPVVRFFTGKQVAADDFLGVETHGYLAAVASPCPDQGLPVMQSGFLPRRTGERSVPSGEPASAPVRAHSVGITSAWKAGWVMVFPGLFSQASG